MQQDPMFTELGADEERDMTAVVEDLFASAQKLVASGNGRTFFASRPGSAVTK
jgi:hypothetical protein